MWKLAAEKNIGKRESKFFPSLVLLPPQHFQSFHSVAWKILTLIGDSWCVRQLTLRSERFWEGFYSKISFI